MGIYKNLWDDCKITIQYLPNEIMEMIFKEMESLKDVRRCSNTCKKWKNIISKMYTNKGEHHNNPEFNEENIPIALMLSINSEICYLTADV